MFLCKQHEPKCFAMAEDVLLRGHLRMRVILFIHCAYIPATASCKAAESIHRSTGIHTLGNVVRKVRNWKSIGFPLFSAAFPTSFSSSLRWVMVIVIVDDYVHSFGPKWFSLSFVFYSCTFITFAIRSKVTRYRLIIILYLHMYGRVSVICKRA